MQRKRISVTLSDDEWNFIQNEGRRLYHAKSAQQVMQLMFYLQLREDRMTVEEGES